MSTKASVDCQHNYVVPVDYDLAHPKQIEAASFGWVTKHDANLILRDPAEHLIKIPTGQIDQRITLVDPEGYATDTEMLARMDRMHLRPTTSPETLAFARVYPDVQRQHPLVGLGSVWVDSLGRRRVLCLCEGSNGRCLVFGCLGIQWDPLYHFLAAPM